jgi:rfaE bifunctional protein kinase chain/domain
MVVDLVVDRFISGIPKRISREAPVLILRYEGEHIAPGGGANAVANVAALGGQAVTVGVVGADASGRDLTAALAACGVDTGGLTVRPGFRTPTKTRLLAGSTYSVRQQVVRWDVEDFLAPDPALEAAFVERLAGIPGLRVLVLSDYGYGAVSPSLGSALRQRLGPGVLLLCDSRYRLGEFRCLDAATPNQEEAEALLGHPLSDAPAELAAAGWRLAELLGTRVLLITRGSRGMALFVQEHGGVRLMAQIPVHGNDQVADVTGAGDTVIGAFALALAAGATPLEAALLANYAGGIVVRKMGTAVCTPGELAAAVSSDPLPVAGVRWARS